MAEAKAKSTKIGKIRTPQGIAAFAYLKKPDSSFGKMRYRINVFFDADAPEFDEFTGKLKKAAAAFSKKIGRKLNPLPIKLTNEKLSKSTGQPVGTPFMEFETKFDENQPRPVPVFDASNTLREDVFVYGGDIVKVEGNVTGWELPTGAGLKIYLNAVQLLKSNWKGGAGASFEKEEEFLGEDIDPEADGDDLEEESFEDEELDEDDDLDSEDEDDLDPTQGIL
jgi:hypothetical protein